MGLRADSFEEQPEYEEGDLGTDVPKVSWGFIKTWIFASAFLIFHLIYALTIYKNQYLKKCEPDAPVNCVTIHKFIPVHRNNHHLNILYAEPFS